uniref:Uncharacterized protein n=1 Tax=Physcomitrium patens TaxID=3218 RepID=A0A7I4E1E4_PHYPA
MDSAVFLAGQQSGYGVFREFSVPQKRQWRSSGQNLRPRKRNKTSHRGGGVSATGRSYDPLRLSELQRLNKIRTCKHFPKRRKSVARVPPRAPFNDSSYLMRVRQSGGLASSPSPATPATPAFVSTPVFASPAPQFQFREGPEGFPEDYGYGSMEGLIHLKAGSDEPSHVSSRSNNDVEADVKDYGYGSMEGLIRLRSRPDEPTLTSSHRLSPAIAMELLGRCNALERASVAKWEAWIAVDVHSLFSTAVVSKELNVSRLFECGVPALYGLQKTWKCRACGLWIRGRWSSAIAMQRPSCVEIEFLKGAPVKERGPESLYRFFRFTM